MAASRRRFPQVRKIGTPEAMRAYLAEQGIEELSRTVDSLITIPNEKLLTVLGGETTLLDAFTALLIPPLWRDFNAAAREGE